MSAPHPNGDALLVEALAALARGWVLTPLEGKRPILRNWQRQPPPTEEHVRQWVADGHNLGLRTGRISGIVGIDDDTVDGSGARELGLPETVTVITGSGMRHYLFRAPDMPVGNSASRLHDRVDVRGDGGQLVLVGSIHPDTGQPYRWLEEHSPIEIEMAALPAHIIDRLAAGEQATNGHVPPGAAALPEARLPELHRYAQGALRRSVARVATAADGQRNNALNKAAFNLGKFVGAGLLDQVAVQDKLLTAAVAVGLPEREARDTIASGLGAGAAKPLDIQELPKKRERNGSRLPPAVGNEVDTTTQPDDPLEEPPRLEIHVQGGKLPESVDLAEAVLLSNGGLGVYQRGSILVRTHRVETDSAPTEAIRRKKGALVIRPIEAPYLVDVLTRHADFLKFDKRSQEWVSIDCPEKVALTYMARAGEWRVPPLRAVIEAPTLRPSGSILSSPGYDRESGLLFDHGDVTFDPIRVRPTLDDARKALDELLVLLEGFPFVAPCDRSVALAAIFTALIRRSIRSSPLFAFRAPVMGSGKSLLADCVALIATGRDACMMAQGKDEDEIRKRILAILIQGDAIACVDNVTHALDSAALCSVLTQESYQDRLLGFSQMVRVPTSMTWLATGNNMVFEGDLITRVLPCDIDPACEHPEARKFQVNLRRYVPEHRARLAIAPLTVMLAYQVAGCPDQGLPEFGRFEDWSRWVRSALVWVGEADPCESRSRLEEIDPVTRRLRAVLQAWKACYGSATLTAAQVITGASPDLVAALAEVAPGRSGQLDARQLGTWLHAHQKRVDLGLRLERAGERSGTALWMVARAGAVGPVGPVGPLNPTREESQAAIHGVIGGTLPQVPRVPRPAEPPPAGDPEKGDGHDLGDEGEM